MENEKLTCPISKKCGGCIFQGLTYKEQIIKKQHMVYNLLGKFGKVLPIIEMKEPYFYRNKVHRVFGYDRGGVATFGLYEERSHKIIPCEKCLIEDEKCQEINKTVETLARSFKLKFYDEDKNTGLLRHVLVRRGYKTQEVMVVLVMSTFVFPGKNNFVEALIKEHPEIKTIVCNLNVGRSSYILGKESRTIYGPGYITDELLGLTFRISANSFYQVNPIQTETLYKEAVSSLELTGKETIVDAYCGTGTIGLYASKKAKNVIGCELSKSAIRDAIMNARDNKIKNETFVCQDAGEFLVNEAKLHHRYDAVIMDPPRSGSSVEFINALGIIKPKKIVYVSCSPESLARDLELIIRKGYEIKKIQPVEMFPWTEHVETVALLSKAAK